jgi:hypothetical protein
MKACSVMIVRCEALGSSQCRIGTIILEVSVAEKNEVESMKIQPAQNAGRIQSSGSPGVTSRSAKLRFLSGVFAANLKPTYFPASLAGSGIPPF